MTNGNGIVEICCAMFIRASELVENKMAVSKALKQASEEMREYANRNEGKPIKEIHLP